MAAGIQSYDVPVVSCQDRPALLRHSRAMHVLRALCMTGYESIHSFRTRLPEARAGQWTRHAHGVQRAQAACVVLKDSHASQCAERTWENGDRSWLPMPMVASDQTSMTENTPSSRDARRFTQGAARHR